MNQAAVHDSFGPYRWYKIKAMSTKVKNILFTCAAGGSPIFFARSMQKTYNFFFADAGDQNAAPHLGIPFHKIPFGNSPAFPGEIEALIKKWNIDCVVPGTNRELPALIELAKNNQELLMVMPSAEFIHLCIDKKRLMNELAEAHISFLLPYKTKGKVVYPAIAKPVSGEGSRQFHVVKTPEQLEGYLNLYDAKFEDILVQPYIEGAEYTISVIVNNRNKIVGVVPKRVIEKRGITRAAVSEHNELLEKLCTDIVAKYNPRGPFNVQLKLFAGKGYVFEINPRLSTTSVLSDRAFGNEVELYIKYHNAEEIKNPPELKSGVYLSRYGKKVFVT
jgi:carbamoyl-phosphate synthase large subunit